MPLQRLLTAAIPGVLAFSLLSGSAGAAGPSRAPAALLATSLANAQKQQSVHFVTVSSLGDQSISVVADAAKNAGQASIVLFHGKQRGLVAVRYNGKDVYYRANAVGLESYLGMPAALATKYAGKWISFAPTDPDYADITKSLTISTALSDITIQAPLKLLAPRTINRVRSIGVAGTTTSLSSAGSTGTGTLFLAAASPFLPVVFTGTGTQKNQKELGRVTFSHWNAPVHPVTPSSAIPASSISKAGNGTSGGSSTGASTGSSTATTGG
jgi:hypothetical protein